MNKKILEEMFDEKLKDITIDYDDYWNPLIYNWNNNIINFIFETIIPEVLKSILETNWERSNDFTKSKISWNYIFKDIKQKAKELYWIDL